MDLFGFPRDLIDPPDGGYSFIEWDDLNATQRVALALRKVSVAMKSLTLAADKAVVSLRGMESVLYENIQREGRDGSNIMALVQVIEANIKIDYERRKNIELSNRRMKAEFDKAMVESGVNASARYLRADPREIDAIGEAIRAGNLGEEKLCREPLPALTCINIQGKWMTGVIPGNIIDGITCSPPVFSYDDKPDPFGVVKPIYAQRVFRKNQ